MPRREALMLEKAEEALRQIEKLAERNCPPHNRPP